MTRTGDSARKEKANRSTSIALKLLVTLGILGSVGSLRAQETSNARAIVTVTSKSTEDVITVPQQSISLSENRKTQEVSGWVPLRGQRAGLQLVVLVDDASRGNLGLQLNDLKSFVNALPPSTQVAIGYMRNGAPNLMQGFTSDHAEAAK
jgi:hypothetical protein